MKELTEATVKSYVEEQIKEWFKFSPEEIKLEFEPEVSRDFRPDFKLRLYDKTFFIEYMFKTSTDRLWAKFEEIRSWKQEESKALFIFIVPYMPEKAREKCKKNNIFWMDLSGNAHIAEPPIFIHIEGKKNKFKKPGRQRSVFAPKTSKVPMYFLLNPEYTFTVKQLAKETDLDPSTVSRATRRLKSLGFIQEIKRKGRAKPYKLLSPFTILEAWAEDYNFFQHNIVKGALAETKGKGFLESLDKLFEGYTGKFALSGPRVTKFYDIPGESPLTVAFVDDLPPESELGNIRFKKGSRGSNLWLVKPKSAGVFMGSKLVNGLKIVNKIQLYLDLYSIKAQRSEDLAGEVYAQIRKEFEDAGF
jgi:DNA-binding Lrp family transcriptional regulator